MPPTISEACGLVPLRVGRTPGWPAAVTEPALLGAPSAFLTWCRCKSPCPLPQPLDRDSRKASGASHAGSCAEFPRLTRSPRRERQQLLIPILSATPCGAAVATTEHRGRDVGWTAGRFADRICLQPRLWPAKTEIPRGFGIRALAGATDPLQRSPSGGLCRFWA